ncbi:E3 ubiquitin-protein ligase MARCHF2-like [Ptychodera flava]|uniref:E3 ubiquitin-protein ligase MARCHF2-like n=1 Tax=Ptychodera flava TaxID=63121 RepID=UPI00396A44B7
METTHTSGTTVPIETSARLSKGTPLIPVVKLSSSGIITTCTEQPVSLDHHGCLSVTSFSTVVSDGPICRICHEGDKAGEELISPCRCTGTMSYLHRGCIEQWLATANSTQCELCNYEFRTKRRPQSIRQWIQQPSQNNDRRNFAGDVACFFILTPLVSISAWLCLNGAQHYLNHKGHSWEAAGLVGLTIILILIYTVWAALSCRYHIYVWQAWRRNNQIVQLVTVESPTRNNVDSSRSQETVFEAIYSRETQV